MEKLFKKYLPMTETFFYILSSLTQARHGYAVIKHVKEITDNRINLGAGTIYGSLSKMQRDGLISLYEDKDRKTVYIITETGRELLRAEIERIKKVYNYIIEVEGNI